MKQSDYALAVVKVNSEKDSIIQALDNGTTIKALSSKYNMHPIGFSRLLDSLGIKKIGLPRSSVMSVDLRKLERVCRKLCSELNVDYESI